MLLVAAQPRAEYHAPGEHDARGDRPPITVVGSMTREVFEAYVERILLPTLRPGQIVVMDLVLRDWYQCAWRGPLVVARA